MLCAEARIDTGFFPSGPGSQCGLIHNDHLGTPQKMTDSSGTIIWAADYKPFGEATITVSTLANNLRFPGQYFDAETGSHYNYFRDYNPVIGRYVEADPFNIGSIRLFQRKGIKNVINSFLVAPSSQHLFSYATNNPLRFDDPKGLSPNYEINIVCGRASLTNYFLCTRINNTTCPPTITFLGIFLIENAPCIGACIFTEEEWNTYTSSPWAS